jgi:hypothetical protein
MKRTKEETIQEINRLQAALLQANEKWAKACIKRNNDLKSLKGTFKAQIESQQHEITKQISLIWIEDKEKQKVCQVIRDTFEKWLDSLS